MRKLKVIMIDAFKPSYLEHAPFLRSLTEQYRWGELNMGFGHWRGVEVLFKGESEVIANFYHDGRGSLTYLKYFQWLGYFGKLGRFCIDVLFNFPRWMRRYELLRTGNIPLNRLWTFDVAVKQHIARQKCEFFYFGALDELGHQYGTKSKEIISAIQAIDKKISTMNFDFIFSDHGMIDITKKVSVPWIGDCFIDSDMARYWGSKKELAEIHKKLPLADGRIVKWNALYGELIFLAKTGVLIYPNFWNKTVVKGMHGYDGKHPDMKAFYILKKKGKKKNVSAEELHRVLQQYSRESGVETF